jgi:flagellar basal-body rod protein FlgG
MIKSLNTAATGMKAQQDNIDVISNNIANVNTTGFKRSRAEFEDLLYKNVKEPGTKTGENSQSPTGVQTGTGVRTAAVQKEFETGSVRMTKNPFDVAIEGEGFLPVLMPDGQTGYTRDGALKKDSQGRITDKNGYPLQPEITVPPNVAGISISPEGEVAVITAANSVPEAIGRVELVNFINPAGLKSAGRNLYLPSASSGIPQQGTPGQNGFGSLSQGQLETSNVNIVESMIDMITAQRAYETNSKVIQASDQMLQTTNNLR